MPNARTLVLVLALAAAAPAGAADLVAGVHGGYGAYTQEDLNGVISLLNSQAGEDAIPQIKGGWEFGAHLGMRINDTTILGVGFGSLSASTSGTAGQTYLDVDAPARAWHLFVNWLPDSDQVGRFGLGADAGFVTVDGRAIYPDESGARTVEDWEGDGLFLAVYAVGDLALGAGLSIVTHGGFRLAQVPDIAIEGLSSSDDLDYSGMFVRVGLRWAP